jgi:hypothetical protein
LPSWKQLLKLPPEELARHDLAEVNVACAADLPGSEMLDPLRCIRTLDQWADQVQCKTLSSFNRFERNPAEYGNSVAYFRILVMVTVLIREIGVHYHPLYKANQLALAKYDPELLANDGFFKDARNLFVHGPVLTKQGTCTSLPPLYISVGRRLGYPLKLVATMGHSFARWDEPGERFNIECASHGLNCHPDEHYLSWPLGATAEQVKRFCLLRSKSPREELAAFLSSRGQCWYDNGNYQEAADSFAGACLAAPDNEACPRALEIMLRHRATNH